jgi:hypothetical protein
MEMRQRRSNVYFTFFYPGYMPGGATPPGDAPYIAIPDNGQFASICTADGCAVFHSPNQLRQLAEVLQEAADVFEANNLKQ